MRVLIPLTACAALLVGCQSYEIPYGMQAYKVGENLGGPVVARAFNLRPNRVMVFNDVCASACTMTADIARRLGGGVCITSRAVFFFHAIRTGSRWENDTDRFYSPDIAAWVRKHGGFPKTLDLKDMTVMTFMEARQFWPVCKL